MKFSTRDWGPESPQSRIEPAGSSFALTTVGAILAPENPFMKRILETCDDEAIDPALLGLSPQCRERKPDRPINAPATPHRQAFLSPKI